MDTEMIIILAVTIPGVVLILLAIVLIVLFVRPIRKRIFPYRDRANQLG